MTLREEIARAVAGDFERQDGFGVSMLPDDLSWPYVDQGEVNFGEVADAVIAALDALGFEIREKNDDQNFNTCGPMR